MLDAIARNLELSTEGPYEQGARRRAEQDDDEEEQAVAAAIRADRTMTAVSARRCWRCTAHSRRGAASVGDRSAEGRDAGRGSVAARALR